MYRQCDDDECTILYQYPSGHILCAITEHDASSHTRARLYDRDLWQVHLSLSTSDVRELLSKHIESSTLRSAKHVFYNVGGVPTTHYQTSVVVKYVDTAISSVYHNSSIYASAIEMLLSNVPEYDAFVRASKLYVVPRHVGDFVKLRPIAYDSKTYQQRAILCIAVLLTRTTLPSEVIRVIAWMMCECARRCYAEYCVHRSRARDAC